MSRHRFDHSVDHSDDTKELSAPARAHRIEVITGVERRRKWSAQEKAAIVAESLAEGAIVSDVARRHGLSPQQLFGWRARVRDAVKGSVPSSDATPTFVPAIVEDDPPSPALPRMQPLKGHADGQFALDLRRERMPPLVPPESKTTLLQALAALLFVGSGAGESRYAGGKN